MYAEMGLPRRVLTVFVRWEVVFFVRRAAFCPLGGFLQLFLRREITINDAAFFHVTYLLAVFIAI